MRVRGLCERLKRLLEQNKIEFGDGDGDDDVVMRVSI